MQTINSESSLRAEILRLESNQARQGELLKEHFLVVYESVKPVNLILRTLKDITGSQELKTNLLNTTVGMTTGYLTKLLYERGTRNPVKKVLGNALMLGVVNLVAKNPEAVSTFGKALLRFFNRKPDNRGQSA